MQLSILSHHDKKMLYDIVSTNLHLIPISDIDTNGIDDEVNPFYTDSKAIFLSILIMFLSCFKTFTFVHCSLKPHIAEE